MFGIQARRSHRRLEVETQPFLNSDSLQLRRALSQIEEENQVEDDRRGEDRIAAEEIDFDLHRVVEPAEDVDVVPAFFVIAARWVVVDADLVKDIPVELWIKIGLENVLEHAELGFFFGLERSEE